MYLLLSRIASQDVAHLLLKGQFPAEATRFGLWHTVGPLQSNLHVMIKFEFIYDKRKWVLIGEQSGT